MTEIRLEKLEAGELKLWVKSPEIERWIKKNKFPERPHPRQLIYDLGDRPGWTRPSGVNIIAAGGTDYLFRSGRVNMNFLTLVGVSNGVSYTVTNVPYKDLNKIKNEYDRMLPRILRQMGMDRRNYKIHIGKYFKTKATVTVKKLEK